MFKSLKKKELTIEGMHCKHCQEKVVNGLKELNGVKKVKVNLEKKQATISLKEDVEDELISSKLDELGFELKSVEVK